MSGKKPRRIKYPPTVNALSVVMSKVAKVTHEEIAGPLQVLKTALAHMRMGLATERDWSVLAGMLEVSQEIERTGIVRGLHEHLQAAEDALKKVWLRAQVQGGGWRPPTLWWHELEAIQVFIELHEFQCQQLGGAEYDRALANAERYVIKKGERVEAGVNADAYMATLMQAQQTQGARS